jgi:hypothetical protein
MRWTRGVQSMMPVGSDCFLSPYSVITLLNRGRWTAEVTDRRKGRCRRHGCLYGVAAGTRSKRQISHSQ